jgi:predicted RNase H-like nuclease (RuvC/YqgF family)
MAKKITKPEQLDTSNGLLIIGIDLGIKTTGIAIIDMNEAEASTTTKAALPALQHVTATIIEEKQAIILAIEDPFTHTGHVKEKGTRVYQEARKQGAGYVKCLYRLYEQLYDQYRGSNVAFVPVPVQTTHARGQLLRLESVAKEMNFTFKNDHEREAMICALVGYERVTGKNFNCK